MRLAGRLPRAAWLPEMALHHSRCPPWRFTALGEIHESRRPTRCRLAPAHRRMAGIGGGISWRLLRWPGFHTGVQLDMDCPGASARSPGGIQAVGSVPMAAGRHPKLGILDSQGSFKGYPSTLGAWKARRPACQPLECVISTSRGHSGPCPTPSSSSAAVWANPLRSRPVRRTSNWIVRDHDSHGIPRISGRQPPWVSTRRSCGCLHQQMPGWGGGLVR